MVGYKYILHREQGSRRGEENDWTFQSIGADEQTWLTYVSVKKKKINIKVLNFNCLKPTEKKEKNDLPLQNDIIQTTNEKAVHKPKYLLICTSERPWSSPVTVYYTSTAYVTYIALLSLDLNALLSN